MIKPLITLVLGVFLYTASYAQQGGLLYYLKNNGKLVSNKDSADYSMLVLPPDTDVDKNLYIVYEYNKNGNRILITGSKTNDINLKYEGHYITFYANGHRKKIGTFIGGNPIGHETEYYPNGKLYYVKDYFTERNDITENEINRAKAREFRAECRDSTGTILAANGNGTWVEFDEDFKNVVADGPIVHGDKNSTWYIRNNGFVIKQEHYKDGRLLSYTDNTGITTFSQVDGMPEFPGGIEAFSHFLGKNMRYPAVARENGTQGKVIVSFMVEEDGTLTNVRVSRGIGAGCDEESKRVIELSSPWKPGIKDGQPVRVAYSVPISFTLSR
ncbi:MAG: TonB family protein [Mucilaginibacter sp.]